MTVSVVVHNVVNDKHRKRFMDAFFEKIAGGDDFEVISDNIVFARHDCSSAELFRHLKASGFDTRDGSGLHLMVAELSGTNVSWSADGATSGWLDRHLNDI
ncbi:hypothetical protein [Stenotrophomonas maltophilia]|uniref:hypothetical protein n=1 Tax=Stenotrophomonas maltophilia TaxID=40324 RepID=UPI000A526C9A|nr:hypothetical protein [Stenotrophomonas maltophilia]